jgi:hypothetical protein
VVNHVLLYVGILSQAVNDVLETAKPLMRAERGRSWSDLDPAKKEQLAHELCWTVELESRGYIVGAAFLLAGERVRDLRQSWDRYHDNLPFDAAELRWLNAAHLSVAREDPATSADDPEAGPAPDFVGRLGRIASQRGHIINRGLVVEVGGSELIDRWWDWRRGVGAYAGRDAAGEAFEAPRHVNDLAALVEGREDSGTPADLR